MKANLRGLKQFQVLFLFKRVIHKLKVLSQSYFPKGTFPKLFSQGDFQSENLNPKGQLPKCAIYQAATSQRLG